MGSRKDRRGAAACACRRLPICAGGRQHAVGGMARRVEQAPIARHLERAQQPSYDADVVLENGDRLPERRLADERRPQHFGHGPLVVLAQPDDVQAIQRVDEGGSGMQPVDASSRDRREVVEAGRVLLVGAEGVLQSASARLSRATATRDAASSRLRLDCALRERRKRERRVTRTVFMLPHGWCYE